MARWFLIMALGFLAPTLLGLGIDAQAQQPGGRAPSIAFRNDTKMAVIVQGATEVKSMQRRGQPLLINAGKTSYDTNLPPGDRLITIYDANQATKVLNRLRIPVRNIDLQFVIRVNPANPKLIIIVPDTNP